MNKTICIYHSRDLDGWMSAAIVKKWFEENNENTVVYPYDKTVEQLSLYENDLIMLAWDYGDDIPDLKDYDKVIMADISFPSEIMWKLHNKLRTNFIWIDHHSSAIKDVLQTIENESYDALISGIRDTSFAACELMWTHFFPNNEIPEIVRLLGRYDCFGHKGTEEEQKVLEFQYGARQWMSNYEVCYKYLEQGITPSPKTGTIYNALIDDIWNDGITIYQYLKTEAKQTYKKSFPITFNTVEQADPEELYGTEPKSTLHIHRFLAVNQERFNPINFGINYHKDGYDGYACFWYKDSKWSWSLYNDDGNTDCSVIAKTFGGGGHKGASGFVIADLNKIL